jgi:hypothetical protein
VALKTPEITFQATGCPGPACFHVGRQSIRAVIGLSRPAIRSNTSRDYPAVPRKIISGFDDMNVRRTSPRHAIAAMPRSASGMTGYVTSIVLAMGVAVSGCGPASSAAKPPADKSDPAPWNDSRWHRDSKEQPTIAAHAGNRNDDERIA